MTFNDIQDYRGEEWKLINFPEEHDILPEEYVFISTYGRLVRLENDTPTLLKTHNINGYPQRKFKTTKTTQYRGYNKRKMKGYYLHKLVAQAFLKQGDAKFVLHLDYDKQNNHVTNLKWATKREKELHQWKNPVFIESKKNMKRTYAKLTENNVRLIKKMINDPNRRTRLKIIAKRFGVTTMQLQRIKTGENWADVPSL